MTRCVCRDTPRPTHIYGANTSWVHRLAVRYISQKTTLENALTSFSKYQPKFMCDIYYCMYDNKSIQSVAYCIDFFHILQLITTSGGGVAAAEEVEQVGGSVTGSLIHLSECEHVWMFAGNTENLSIEKSACMTGWTRNDAKCRQIASMLPAVWMSLYQCWAKPEGAWLNLNSMLVITL